MNLYILFESWNPHVDLKGLCEPFGMRASIGVLEGRKIRKSLPFKLIDTLALIFSRQQKAHVRPIDNTYRMCEGDIVIRVV